LDDLGNRLRIAGGGAAGVQKGSKAQSLSARNLSQPRKTSQSRRMGERPAHTAKRILHSRLVDVSIKESESG